MAHFSLGLQTYKVPMAMHKQNRERLVSAFAEAGVSAEHSAIILQGGEGPHRYDTDYEPLFRQESHFNWCFGVKESNCFGAILLPKGTSYLFIQRYPPEYALWMGAIEATDSFKARYEVDEVRYVDELDKVLREELKIKTLHTLNGVNSDSGRTTIEAKFPGIEHYTTNNEKLYNFICECRVIKSQEEIKLLRWVNKISCDAHIHVMKNTKPGMAEYQQESMFLHHVYTNAGCRHVAYTCICPSGCNSAILHYGHSGEPNSKIINDGDMCLLDMGAEYHCYCSDITCSYPANGKFTPDQKAIYETVLAAQRAVMKAMKPGVLWPDMHKLAERVILEGLQKHGLLVSGASIDDMMEIRLGAVFFPHGLGHFMGLDTHDVGGYLNGLQRINLPGLKSLRTVRELKAGMVLTVEPGIYFVGYLLDEALSNPEKSKYLIADRVNQFRKFGGVRLEDDVVVTADGIENFTKCPREVAEIEAIMAGK